MSVIDEIAAEHKRQIEIEGWTPEHDDQHERGELAAAAGCYTLEGSCADIDSKFPRKELPDGIPRAWPWGPQAWKPKDIRRNLIRAAALLVAEIERLDRM